MNEYSTPIIYNWQTANHKVPIIYKAILTQTGTADPVATILENTLNTNVIWTRDSAGEYTGTLEGGEFNTSTFVLTSLGNTPVIIIQGYTTGSTIKILTKNSPIGAVDLSGTEYVEVQVYI
jgi:hypothetical protein